MSVSGGQGQGQQGGDNFNNRNVNTFHTPSFGDEDFDLPPLSLPSDQDTVNSVSQQPFSHQMLANLDLGMNQPLTVSPTMQTADCAPLSSMRDVHPVAPKFPPQNFDVPDINVTNSVMASVSNADNIFSSIAASTGAMFAESELSSQSPITSHQALSTISQSQMANQLGFHTAMQGTSPAGSNSTSSPSRESSEDSDDSLPLAQLMSLKRTATVASSAPPSQPVEIAPVTTTEPPGQPTTTTTSVTTGQVAAPSVAKKQKTPKKKKKKDPNEPQKPVSAYALFFRDTQAAIKGQSPNKSFGDVSKIVASMWDSLDPDNKNVYKKKTELAKKEYLKQLAAYRASQVSQAAQDEASSRSEKSPSPPIHNQMSVMPPSGVNSVGTMSQMSHMNMPSPPQQTTTMMTSSYNSPPHQPMQQLQNLTSQTPMLTQHNNGMVYQQSPDYSQNLSPMDSRMSSNGLCVRNGCGNHAIENPGWDNEYCSNECVVSHCRDIFTAWVASKQNSSTFQVK